VALSRRTLERLFEQHLGRTPRREIQNRQLERACELLITTALSVDRIAAEVGLKPGKYFYEFFRNILGQTPNQYRKANQLPPYLSSGIESER